MNQPIYQQLTQISNSLASTETQIQGALTQMQTGLQVVQMVLSNFNQDAEAIRSLAQQLQQQNQEE